jgi:hypothetical protein
MFPTSGACSCAKVGKCRRRLTLTEVVSLACLEAKTGERCYGAKWHGTAGMAEEQRTGQVLTVAAAAPRADWP